MPGSDVDDALTRVKDGHEWRLGAQPEISWFTDATTPGLSIAAAIPLRYEAYATVLIPEDDAARYAADTALVGLLETQASEQPWWLGYLETGAHDVVFADAPRVMAYTNWPYVLVEAGPAQALSWRADDPWRGRLPDLIFPVDRTWLVSMLWDDDWRCLGGPQALIRAVLDDPALDARRVDADGDATPPGFTAR